MNFNSMLRETGYKYIIHVSTLFVFENQHLKLVI